MAALRAHRRADGSAVGTDSLSGPILSLGDSVVIASARRELQRALPSLLGRDLSETTDVSKASIVLGTVDLVRRRLPRVPVPKLTNADAFWLGTTMVGNRRVTIVAGHDDRGALYGAFALLRHNALHDPIVRLNKRSEPAAPIRWTNEWNNLDGTIERGYTGPSIFFENGRVAADLGRAAEYARLLASVGINGCAVNNVNADARAIAPEFIPQLARIADVLRPWGVALAVSLDFSSPMKIGGLETFDPVDPRVAACWGAASTTSTVRSPISVVSSSKPIPRDASVRPPTDARTPTPRTSWLARWRRTRGFSSIAGSSTTT